MTTFETTVPLHQETATNTGPISSQSEPPNPAAYSTQTRHENHSLPSGGTQVAVMQSAGTVIPNSELTVNPLQQQPSPQSDYLASAGEAARKYLPTRVVNALGVGSGDLDNNTTTLPSEEHTFKPSSGGVGSLPGNLSEVSVAKLPEERALEKQVGSSLGREGAIGTIADPQNVDSIRVKAIDTPTDTLMPPSSSDSAAKFSDPIVQPYPPSGDGVALQHLARPDVPSTEHTRPLPTFISSDLTPATESEPQISNTQSTIGHVEDSERDSLQKKNHDANVNKDSAIGSEKDVSRTPHFSSDNTSPNQSHARQSEGDTSKSYATDQAARKAPKTTPGEGHKEKFHETPNAQNEQNEQNKPHADKSSSLDSKASSTADHDQGNKERKPSITQKIKGEVKVLAGKLSNNQDKVESGQALKTGQAA